MSDKRKFPRVDHGFAVKFTASEAQRAKNSFTNDLSIGGVAFRTKQPYKEGTEMNITLSQPELSSELEFSGKVVRSGDKNGAFYTAIEFRNPNRMHLEMLESIIYY